MLSPSKGSPAHSCPLRSVLHATDLWDFYSYSSHVCILFEILQGAPSTRLHPNHDLQGTLTQDPRPTLSPSLLYLPPPPLLTPGTLASGLFLESAQHIPDSGRSSLGFLCRERIPQTTSGGPPFLRRLLQVSSLPAHWRAVDRLQAHSRLLLHCPTGRSFVCSL